VQVLGQTLLERSVHAYAVEARGQPLQQTIAQRAHTRRLVGHVFFRDARSLAEARNARHVQRARPDAALVAAAFDHRAQRQFASHVERAAALRAVHLVRGHRQQIDAEIVDVDRHLPGGLRGVGVHERAGGMRERRQFANRLQRADFVVGHHHADEQRAFVDGRACGVEVDESLTGDREKRHVEAGAFEPAAGLEHRLVLDGRRHDAVTKLFPDPGKTFATPANGQVVRLGRATREDDLARRRADERRETPAAFLDGLLRLPAPLVRRTGRIAERLGEIRQHDLEHPGVDRGRRVIVEIDRQFHSGFPTGGGKRRRHPLSYVNAAGAAAVSRKRRM